MPLKDYISLCEKNAKIITSKDSRNPQKHIAYNDSNSDVYHYKIDGEVIKDGNKCDFLLIKDSLPKVAFLIELKGSDLCWAANQIQSTEDKLKSELSSYELQYRIIANRCKTQEIETSAFKKYRMKWGNKLIYKTLLLEEHI